MMRINWRKPIIDGILHTARRQILNEYNLIKSLEYSPANKVHDVEKRRLTDLLLHSWKNIDYYHDVFEDCGVVRDGKVNLDKFEDIPFLTKSIIHEQGERIKAKSLPHRKKTFASSSGGSTGQPVRFWQDKLYWEYNIAQKLFHFEMLGKKPGEPELKIWGSPEDLFEGTIGLRAKAENFLYNRQFQQCFRLTEDDIKKVIKTVNRSKPKIIWSYLDGVYIVANYINKHGIKIHKPSAIFAGATTMYSHIVQTVEKGFGAPVIDFYGSREVGDVACQCEQQGGLHIASIFNKVETIDEKGASIREATGELVITSLMNYTMPFIRYRIGDLGKLIDKKCPCGRSFPVMDPVAGRVIEVFVNSNGDRVDSYFFIHHLSVTKNFTWLNKFQVIQEDYDKIRLKMILEEGTTKPMIQSSLDDVTEDIRVVMGDQCQVVYDIVDDIPLSKSGKHIYTIRKYPEKIPDAI